MRKWSTRVKRALAETVLLLQLVLLPLVVSCDHTPITPEPPVPKEDYITLQDGSEVKAALFEKGLITLKVSEELASALEEDPGAFIESHIWMGAKSVERTFPEAGEFEERSRRAGLHLFYNLTFDESVPLTRAGNSLFDEEGIESAEYVPITLKPDFTDLTWMYAAAPLRAATDSAEVGAVQNSESYVNEATWLFNDPKLKYQWGYFNDGIDRSGQSVTMRKGCDVGVLPVWERLRSGNPDVIVGVVDGGIDYDHEDLKGNLWVNPENNVHGENLGYNFFDHEYLIVKDKHGTHVAGTIGAVNNNGKGVCGIAGGDLGHGIKGVKLMSCQIFKPNVSGSGNGAEAIKWACDHGAVIVQNSWSYESTAYMPEHTRAAIDYFNENAGKDADGHQVGPMAGGVVFFSAGNKGTDIVYPGAYEGCVAVAAVGPDYTRPSYSNYGDWVDLAAPGGISNSRGGILSTILDNQYGYLAGTSMACPHASGVAALIVANRGGRGFTRDSLLKLLYNGVQEISRFSDGRPIGKGLANAAASLEADNDAPLQQITIFEPSVKYNSVAIRVGVHNNTPAAVAKGVRIFYSPEQFTDTTGIAAVNFEERIEGSDKELSPVLTTLDYNTRYWLTAVVYDYSGRVSPLSEIVSIVTDKNIPPTFSGDTSPLTVRHHETVIVEYRFSDPEGENVDCSIEKGSGAVTLFKEGQIAKVCISGSGAPAGKYAFTLSFRDESGAETSVTVPYTILSNTAPVLCSGFENIVVGETAQIDLARHFSDEDGEELRYTIETKPNGVVSASIFQGTLSLVPQSAGKAVVTIHAIDLGGLHTSGSFEVISRNGAGTMDIYPNPVTEGKLHIRPLSVQEIRITVTGPTGATVYDVKGEYGPFEPAVVDLGRYVAGVYTVKVKMASGEVTRSIVKL